MRLRIVAVGRLRAGPERDLVDDYVRRAGRAGRPLNLGPVEVTEIDDRKTAGPAAEGTALDRAAGSARRIVLDERGRPLTSPDFAARLAAWRDDGAAETALLVGGADGIDPGLRDGADLVLSLGPMVWPHALARAMLAEQLYRATQILAGTPYHRA